MGLSGTSGLSLEQVEFDTGYGLVTHEGAGLLTTYGGVWLGGCIELGEWVDLSVESERTTQSGGSTHQVALYGQCLPPPPRWTPHPCLLFLLRERGQDLWTSSQTSMSIRFALSIFR